MHYVESFLDTNHSFSFQNALDLEAMPKHCKFIEHDEGSMYEYCAFTKGYAVKRK